MDKIEIKGITYLVGDIHYKFDKFCKLLIRCKIENCNIIALGDIGLGFLDNGLIPYEDEVKLNEFLIDNKIKLYLIRGNHDNPAFWKYPIKETYEDKCKNINLIEDGQFVFINEGFYICIGGSLSIDRIYRENGKSYWKEEKLIIPKYSNKDKAFIDKQQSVNILSHIGPLPHRVEIRNGDILESFYLIDKNLKKDLQEERNTIEQIAKIFKPKKWFYGHYHIDSKFDYFLKNTNIKCISLDELSLFKLY